LGIGRVRPSDDDEKMWSITGLNEDAIRQIGGALKRVKR
jgi:hypothetical protein